MMNTKNNVPSRISPAVMVGKITMSLDVAMVLLTAVQVLEANAKGVLEPIGILPDAFTGFV